LIPVPPETDRGQNNETCDWRVSRQRMLPPKQPDSAVQKTSKKVEKKACQVSESSINEEKLADKPADFPFKNILKK